MECEDQKVYVAVGKDLQDGFKTLEWTLGKWKAHQSISIVILYVFNDISNKDIVDTPYGKLPATYMSDEKFETLKMYEQTKTDNLLSKYIAFCGKVKPDIQRVEKKDDEPIQKLILESISGLKIRKLVMGLSFMKSKPPGKSRSAISGSLYVQKNKPEDCELFIISREKLVFLNGENDEGNMESDQGVAAVARIRERAHSCNWWTKMFAEYGRNNSHRLSTPSKSLLRSRDPQSQLFSYLRVY